MQGGNSEMTGITEFKRGLHRLAITDLTNQYYIRGLTKRGPQGITIGESVDTNLTLVDNGFQVRVAEFDGILDGKDMTGHILVAMINHGSECGGFTGTGGPHHQDQTALVHDQFLEHIRDPQFFKSRDLGRDQSQHHTDIATLAEDIDAKTARAIRHVNGKITFHGFFKVMDLMVVHA